jgi:hypothetical protein
VLKVYISYSSLDEQVTALRLQALAAVNGLVAYVPPAYTRKAGAELDENSKTKLLESDVVLGTVGGEDPSGAWREECRIWSENNKLKILIAVGDQLGILDQQGTTAVVVDATRPSAEAVTRISSFLDSVPLSKEKQKTLLDLSLVALGLVGLAPQD